MLIMLISTLGKHSKNGHPDVSDSDAALPAHLDFHILTAWHNFSLIETTPHTGIACQQGPTQRFCGKNYTTCGRFCFVPLMHPFLSKGHPMVIRKNTRKTHSFFCDTGCGPFHVCSRVPRSWRLLVFNGQGSREDRTTLLSL